MNISIAWKYGIIENIESIVFNEDNTITVFVKDKGSCILDITEIDSKIFCNNYICLKVQ